MHVWENGERIVSDGPFAESKEQLGGSCLLECDDLDEALEWANEVAMGTGSIEVRKVLDLSELGHESKTRPVGGERVAA
ncbi:MAG TPA: YciI family protein [Solirubrobacterales bacterium]|nr:YciI family protein [Solirubrobacterales bacterium]